MYEVIQHHGIKGMKWGVRRTDAQLGGFKSSVKRSIKDANASFNHLRTRINGVIKKVNSHISKKASDPAHKKIKDMTDEELRQRISRLNMEKQYRDIDAYLNPQKKSVVKKLLGEAAENLGRKALSAVVDKTISKVFKTDITLDSLKDSDLTKVGADILKKAAEASKNANMVDSTLSKFLHRPKQGEADSSEPSSKSSDSDTKSSESPKKESKEPEAETAATKEHDTERAAPKSSDSDKGSSHDSSSDSDAFRAPAYDRGMSYTDRWMYGKSGSDAKKEQRAYETYEALKSKRVDKAVETASRRLLEDLERDAESDMRRLGL